MSEKYFWDKLPFEKTGPYVLQLIANRKLTNTYHNHDFYEIVIVIEGECVQVINQKEIVQTANEVIILRPNDNHRFEKQSPSIRILSLSVSREELLAFVKVIDSDIESELENNEYCHFFIGEVQVREIVGKALICLTNENVLVDYKMILFLILLCFVEDIKKSNHRIPNHLNFALKEMKKEGNIREGIPLLLDLTGYSYSHLSRLMKKYLNVTPHEYIVEIRLSIAYRHIIYTDRLLEDISVNVGFESYSHFVKIFKKKYGVTPATLRRKIGVPIV